VIGHAPRSRSSFMIVFCANPVMRLVERIEFPSTSALMICARSVRRQPAVQPARSTHRLHLRLHAGHKRAPPGIPTEPFRAQIVVEATTGIEPVYAVLQTAP
jgi:hypothetical protein